MKYCDKCGNELANNSHLCSNCEKNFKDKSLNSNILTITICTIIGFIFPIIGIILFFILPKYNIDAAKGTFLGGFIKLLILLIIYIS